MDIAETMKKSDTLGIPTILQGVLYARNAWMPKLIVAQLNDKGHIPKDISICEGTHIIAGNGFRNAKCEHIEIPHSIKHIYADAFSSATGFKGTLDLSHIQIGAFAFADTDVEYLKLQDAALGMNAFDKCKNLKSVEIHNKNTLLDDPEVNTQVMGGGVFQNCSSLRTAYLDIRSIGGCAFAECTNLEKLVLVDVEKIGEFAFKNCVKLSGHIDLHNVCVLNTSAFENTSIEAVRYPAHAQVDTLAFIDCRKLRILQLDPEMELKNLYRLHSILRLMDSQCIKLRVEKTGRTTRYLKDYGYNFEFGTWDEIIDT